MKSLILGTAQWGWTIARNDAFALLDHWLKAGYSELDAATNYPINRNPADFRASEKIIAEYIQAHGLNRSLKITMKVGSMDNMRGPEHNLSASFIQMMAQEYARIFDNNLSGIMLHWDNRTCPTEIEASLYALQALQQQGIRPGLSGILHPNLHAAINETLLLNFDIEVKHNVFTSDYARYAPLVQKNGQQHRFWAYGLSAGGIKFAAQAKSGGTFEVRGGQRAPFEDKLAQIEARIPDFNLAFVRPPIVTMQHLGMVYALCSPFIDGAIVAPKTVAQLQETIEWHHNTDMFDYSDVVKILAK